MEEHATAEGTEQQVDVFAGWVFDRILGSMETLSIYLGDRLGMYRALQDAPATADELAARAGVHQRYAREWLEQQAIAGILDVQGEGSEATFHLPAAHAEVLADPGIACVSRAPRPHGGAAGVQLPALLGAYRSGAGVGVGPIRRRRERRSRRRRTGRGSSRPSPMHSRAFPRCTTSCRDRMPASPMSRAATAGRPSPSPRRTPMRSSTDSTSTSLRSRRRASTRRASTG